jgi:hypothetical protein
MINVMSHADYLINEPDELNAKYKDDFRKIFQKFVDTHPFNPTLFPVPVAAHAGAVPAGVPVPAVIPAPAPVATP